MYHISDSVNSAKVKMKLYIIECIHSKCMKRVESGFVSYIAINERLTGEG